MDIHRQVRYPAIARAQQMSAARLGVATPMARAGEERMQQRRVQNEDGAAEGGRQQGEGEAAATPSPWMSKRRDTLTAAVAAAAAAAVGKRFGGASAPPRSHDKRSNPTGDSLSAAKPTRTRTRTANGDTSTAAGSSPSGRRQSSAKRGRARGTVDVPGISSRFLSRSVSPLPVAKVRRGTSREAERRVSIEKTVADIVEVRVARVWSSEHIHVETKHALGKSCRRSEERSQVCLKFAPESRAYMYHALIVPLADLAYMYHAQNRTPNPGSVVWILQSTFLGKTSSHAVPRTGHTCMCRGPHGSRCVLYSKIIVV